MEPSAGTTTAASPPMVLTYEERDGRPIGPGRDDDCTKPKASKTTGSSSVRSGRSGRSRSSSRSMSSSGSKAVGGYRVIFSSAAHYDQWILLVLLLPLALIIFQMVLLLVATTKIADFERSGTVWILGWSLIFILGLYMMILPKQVDIRSNGMIGIKTFLITYQFGEICHAYTAELGPTSSFALGPCTTKGGGGHRFVTCFDPTKHLVIRRRDGKWDVMISPTQAPEFLQILSSMITKLEIQRGSNNIGDATMTTPTPEQGLTAVAEQQQDSAEMTNTATV